MSGPLSSLQKECRTLVNDLPHDGPPSKKKAATGVWVGLDLKKIPMAHTLLSSALNYYLPNDRSSTVWNYVKDDGKKEDKGGEKDKGSEREAKKKMEACYREATALHSPSALDATRSHC